jgi:hypothetical protein
MHVFRTPLLWCERALARLVPAGAAQAFAPVSVVVEAYQEQCLMSVLLYSATSMYVSSN